MFLQERTQVFDTGSILSDTMNEKGTINMKFYNSKEQEKIQEACGG